MGNRAGGTEAGRAPQSEQPNPGHPQAGGRELGRPGNWGGWGMREAGELGGPGNEGGRGTGEAGNWEAGELGRPGNWGGREQGRLRRKVTGAQGQGRRPAAGQEQ